MASRHTTKRYAISKLANIHFAFALAEHFSNVRCIVVHPGAVATNLSSNADGFFLRLFLHLAWPFITHVEKGAHSQLWAAVSPDAQPGVFYGPVGSPNKGSKASQNRELREKLWDWIQSELKNHLES